MSKRINCFQIIVLAIALQTAVSVLAGTQENPVFSTPFYSNKKEFKAQKPPKYLFHWTSQESLAQIAEAYLETESLPLKIIIPTSVVADHYTRLANRDGLFAWSHPVSGMAVGGEMYARSGFKTVGGKQVAIPPGLMAMRISPEARIGYVRSGGYWDSDVPLPRNVDLLYHESYKWDFYGRYNAFQFREWIILNPDVVDWLATNPEDLPSEVRNEIEATMSGSLRLLKTEKMVVGYYDALDFNDLRFREKAKSYLQNPGISIRKFSCGELFAPAP